MKNKKAIIIVVVVTTFLGLMTWSDIHYSNLEDEYVLYNSLYGLNSGIVIEVKKHWGHSYLKVDNGKNIHLRPSNNGIYEFSEFVESGDAIEFDSKSNNILVIKDTKEKQLFDYNY